MAHMEFMVSIFQPSTASTPDPVTRLGLPMYQNLWINLGAGRIPGVETMMAES